jgi:HSP20 family protein
MPLLWDRAGRRAQSKRLPLEPGWTARRLANAGPVDSDKDLDRRPKSFREPTKESNMASLQIYDPFADAGFDDLVRGFFRPVRSTERNAPAPVNIDVTENEKGYAVHAEIPGVNKDDIQVAIEGNQVTIAAEVKPNNEVKEGERVLRTERYSGSVYRSFTLPSELDESNSEARYDNGVLELKLAKKPAVAGRKLAIQ